MLHIDGEYKQGRKTFSALFYKQPVCVSNRIQTKVYDLIELENELGLNARDSEIEIDEAVAKLNAIRQWQWKEN